MRYAFALAALVTTGPVYADPVVCAPRDRIIAMFAKNYGEHPAALGVVADGKAVMEVLVNPETKTFTVVVTDETGTSCLAVAGTNWTELTTKVGDPT